MPSWPWPPQLTWRCLRAVQTKLFNYAPRASNFGRGRGVASADPPVVLAESTEQRTRLLITHPLRIGSGNVPRGSEYLVDDAGVRLLGMVAGLWDTEVRSAT